MMPIRNAANLSEEEVKDILASLLNLTTRAHIKMVISYLQEHVELELDSRARSGNQYESSLLDESFSENSNIQTATPMRRRHGPQGTSRVGPSRDHGHFKGLHKNWFNRVKPLTKDISVRNSQYSYLVSVSRMKSYLIHSYSAYASKMFYNLFVLEINSRTDHGPQFGKIFANYLSRSSQSRTT
jgi:hypothetical protein